MKPNSSSTITCSCTSCTCRSDLQQPTRQAIEDCASRLCSKKYLSREKKVVGKPQIIKSIFDDIKHEILFGSKSSLHRADLRLKRQNDELRDYVERSSAILELVNLVHKNFLRSKKLSSSCSYSCSTVYQERRRIFYRKCPRNQRHKHKQPRDGGYTISSSSVTESYKKYREKKNNSLTTYFKTKHIRSAPCTCSTKFSDSSKHGIETTVHGSKSKRQITDSYLPSVSNDSTTQPCTNTNNKDLRVSYKHKSKELLNNKVCKRKSKGHVKVSHEKDLQKSKDDFKCNNNRTKTNSNKSMSTFKQNIKNARALKTHRKYLKLSRTHCCEDINFSRLENKSSTFVSIFSSLSTAPIIDIPIENQKNPTNMILKCKNKNDDKTQTKENLVLEDKIKRDVDVFKDKQEQEVIQSSSSIEQSKCEDANIKHLKRCSSNLKLLHNYDIKGDGSSLDLGLSEEASLNTCKSQNTIVTSTTCNQHINEVKYVPKTCSTLKNKHASNTRGKRKRTHSERLLKIAALPSSNSNYLFVKPEICAIFNKTSSEKNCFERERVQEQTPSLKSRESIFTLYKCDLNFIQKDDIITRINNRRTKKDQKITKKRKHYRSIIKHSLMSFPLSKTPTISCGSSFKNCLEGYNKIPYYKQSKFLSQLEKSGSRNNFTLTGRKESSMALKLQSEQSDETHFNIKELYNNKCKKDPFLNEKTTYELLSPQKKVLTYTSSSCFWKEYQKEKHLQGTYSNEKYDREIFSVSCNNQIQKIKAHKELSPISKSSQCDNIKEKGKNPELDKNQENILTNIVRRCFCSFKPVKDRKQPKNETLEENEYNNKGKQDSKFFHEQNHSNDKNEFSNTYNKVAVAHPLGTDLKINVEELIKNKINKQELENKKKVFNMGQIIKKYFNNLKLGRYKKNEPTKCHDSEQTKSKTYIACPEEIKESKHIRNLTTNRANTLLLCKNLSHSSQYKQRYSNHANSVLQIIRRRSDFGKYNVSSFSRLTVSSKSSSWKDFVERVSKTQHNNGEKFMSINRHQIDKDNPFSKQYYLTMNVISKKQNLDPNECEPGICVPDECAPQECLKLINKRQVKNKLSGPDITKKSSHTSTRKKVKSKKQQHEPEVKDKKKTKSGTQSPETKKKEDLATKQVPKPRKEAPSGVSLTKNVSATKLKRCICTLKLQKKGKNEKRPVEKNTDKSLSATQKTEQKKSKKTIPGSGKKDKKGSIPKNTVTPLDAKKSSHADKKIVSQAMSTRTKSHRTFDPHACEPNVCIPDKCDPYACLERIKKQSKKTSNRGSSAGPKTRSASISASRKSHKNAQYKVKKSKSSKSVIDKNAQRKVKKSKSSKSVIDKNAKRKVKKSKSSKSVADKVRKSLAVVSKTPKSEFVVSKGRRQAVKIGSSFSFSIEFYKDKSPETEEIQYAASEIKRKKKVRRVSTGSSATATVSRASEVRQKKRKGDLSDSQGQIVKTETHGTTTLRRCYCTLKLHKKSNVSTDQATVVKSQGTKTKHAKKKSNLHSKSSTANKKLLPYECERGVCTPDSCDPKECYERIQLRYQKHSDSCTETGCRKSAGSVQTVKRRKKSSESQSKNTSKSKVKMSKSKRRRQLKSVGSIQSASGKKRAHSTLSSKPKSEESRKNLVSHYGQKKRQAVKVGSSFSFNIEFFKDKTPTTVQLVQYQPSYLSKITKPSVGLLQHNHKYEINKRGNRRLESTSNSLKRCLCTLSLKNPYTNTNNIENKNNKVEYKVFPVSTILKQIKYNTRVSREIDKIYSTECLDSNDETRIKVVNYSYSDSSKLKKCKSRVSDQIFNDINEVKLKSYQKFKSRKKYDNLALNTNGKQTLYSTISDLLVNKYSFTTAKWSSITGLVPYLRRCFCTLRLSTSNKNQNQPSADVPKGKEGKEKKEVKGKERKSIKAKEAKEKRATKNQQGKEGRASKDQQGKEGRASKDQQGKEGRASKDQQGKEGRASKDQQGKEGRASRDQQGKRNGLLPYECGPGICDPAPLLCDPYECYRKMHKPRVHSKGIGPEPKPRPVKKCSPDCTSTHIPKVQRKTQSPCPNYKDGACGGKISYVVEEPRFKPIDNPFRQAVRITSSFSFNIEFYRDKMPPIIEKPPPPPPTIIPPCKDFCAQSPVWEKSVPVQGITLQSRRLQTPLPAYTPLKTIAIGPQRCFCTKGLPDMQEKSAGANLPIVASHMNTGTDTRNLLPYECEPNVCVPGSCDPYECLERIRKRALKNACNLADCPVDTRNRTSQSERPRESKMVPARPLPREKRTSYPVDIRNRQTVRVGSKFSFDVEFFKDRTTGQEVPVRGDANEPCGGRGCTHSRRVSRGTRNTDSSLQKAQMADVKTESRGTGAKGGILKRCFCTLKLQKSPQVVNFLTVDVKSPLITNKPDKSIKKEISKFKFGKCTKIKHISNCRRNSLDNSPTTASKTRNIVSDKNSFHPNIFTVGRVMVQKNIKAHKIHYTKQPVVKNTQLTNKNEHLEMKTIYPYIPQRFNTNMSNAVLKIRKKGKQNRNHNDNHFLPKPEPSVYMKYNKEIGRGKKRQQKTKYNKQEKSRIKNYERKPYLKKILHGITYFLKKIQKSGKKDYDKRYRHSRESNFDGKANFGLSPTYTYERKMRTQKLRKGDVLKFSKSDRRAIRPKTRSNAKKAESVKVTKVNETNKNTRRNKNTRVNRKVKRYPQLTPGDGLVHLPKSTFEREVFCSYFHTHYNHKKNNKLKKYPTITPFGNRDPLLVYPAAGCPCPGQEVGVLSGQRTLTPSSHIASGQTKSSKFAISALSKNPNDKCDYKPLFEIQLKSSDLALLNKDEVLSKVMKLKSKEAKDLKMSHDMLKKLHGAKCKCCICISIKEKRRLAKKTMTKGELLKLEEETARKAREDQRVKKGGIFSKGAQPCVCGSKPCADEADRQATIKERKKALKMTKSCICGTSICHKEQLKAIEQKKGLTKKERERMKDMEKLKNDKLKRKTRQKEKQKKKSKAKQAQQDYAARQRANKKQHERELKERIQSDKAALAVLKKQKHTNDFMLMCESLMDIGKVSLRTLYRAGRCALKAAVNPKDTAKDIKAAFGYRDKVLRKIKTECIITGYPGTCQRLGMRCMYMKSLQWIVHNLERTSFGYYLVHACDKDQKRRFKKMKPATTSKKRPPRMPVNFECSLYMASLKKKPKWMWYFRCPWFYPHWISMVKLWKHFTEFVLFICAIVVWSPLLFCLEVCRATMCCTMCTG